MESFIIDFIDLYTDLMRLWIHLLDVIIIVYVSYIFYKDSIVETFTKIHCLFHFYECIQDYYYFAEKLGVFVMNILYWYICILIVLKHR
jgi:hypothetical protein